MFIVRVWSEPYQDAGMLKGPYSTIPEALAQAEKLVEAGVWDKAEILALGERIAEVGRDEAKA